MDKSATDAKELAGFEGMLPQKKFRMSKTLLAL